MMSHWHGGLLDETTIGTRCCLFVAVRSLCLCAVCSQSVLSPGQVQILDNLSGCSMRNILGLRMLFFASSLAFCSANEEEGRSLPSYAR